MAVKVFSDTRCALGEGPIWAWDRLFWFDIEGRRLHARGRNGAETRWDFAEQASAAALLPDGFLLVAAETGLRILNAAVDIAQECRVEAARLLAAKGHAEPVQYPDFSTKEKAQALNKMWAEGNAPSLLARPVAVATSN